MACKDLPLPQKLTRAVKLGVLSKTEAWQIEAYHQAAGMMPDGLMILPEQLHPAAERLSLHESTMGTRKQ